MTKVFLVRHAEAEGNIYRRAHGQYNGLVTLKGKLQIELLSKRLLNQQIDAVYSSDLTRAHTTALAAAEPRDLNIITSANLREVKMGVWEDMAWGELEYSDKEMHVLFNSDPSKWHVENSETFEQVKNRMVSYISEIAACNDDKTIAVFSHGFAIRTFICHIKGIPPHETAAVPYYDNTAVTLLTFNNGCFEIDYAGDNTHLHGGNSTLEKQSWWRSNVKQKTENLRFRPLYEVADEAYLHAFETNAGKPARADTHYAAYLVDEPVGIIGFDTQSGSNTNSGRLSYIYVVQSHRSCTFGTQLLGQAISDFRKLHREKLYIDLPPGGLCIGFFKKNGFYICEETDNICRLEKEIRNW